MRSKRVLWGLGLGLLVAGQGSAMEGQANKGACRQISIAGEVRAGASFERPIGEGLEVYLQPIASGWILRVVPVGGPKGEWDYAEVATPPYRSVTPLSISTDFSFRAQDAVGWNPRRFRFVTDRTAYGRLAGLVRSLDPAGRQASPVAEREIAGLVAKANQGSFRIVDARLIPGMANQAGMAASVASHFSSTAHTLVPPSEGRPDALGKLLELRFEVGLEVPREFQAAPGVRIQSRACDD